MTNTVQTAQQLLKTFQIQSKHFKFNQRRFPNIITNDETRVYYLEPVRNIGHKILQTKHGRCQENHKNKGLYCIFFSCDGI